MAFTTQNNIGKLLSLKQNPNQKQFEKSGVYQLTCPECNMKYAGQTFCMRFQEYVRDYKYANNKQKFAQHLLDINHSIGPIESITNVLYITNKGRLLTKWRDITSIMKRTKTTR